MAGHPGLPSASLLLGLPLEIRLRIYEFVFTGSKIFVQLVGEDLHDRRLHTHGGDIGIFLTCRQLYHETRSEWYRASLWTIGFPPVLGHFLRSTSSEFLARIEHLTIQLHELPDLDTKSLPSLKLLVVDFTTDVPSFMAGNWYDYDDDKIYSRFAEEAIAREHNTFKVLVTQLHEESRPFHLGLFTSNYDNRYRNDSHFRVSALLEMGFPPDQILIWRRCVQRNELYVNLDTKLVERRTIEQSKADNQDLSSEEKLVHVQELRSQSKMSRSESLAPGHSFVQHGPVIDTVRFKFPPGRQGSFGEEDEDERGSIRESEQDSSCDDSDEQDKEVVHLLKRANWEDVKRIIEHPSEDEQSSSEDEPEREEDVSDSTSLKGEVDRESDGLNLGSRPASPEPEQEQVVSTEVVGHERTESKTQVADVYMEEDQHRRVEERVVCTTSWPE